MKSTTPKEKATEVARWIGVLPAATVASVVAYFVFGSIGWAITHIGDSSATSTFNYYVQVVLYYLPKEVAFVVVGSLVAPRHRSGTAIVLGVTRMLLSFIVHIGGQPSPGTTNFTHFATESVGALLGVLIIFLVERAWSRRASNAEQ